MRSSGRAWLRRAPFLLLAAGGAAAFLAFGDLLALDVLKENRRELIAWRDAHHETASLAYLAVFVAAVASSLPAGFILTLAGGFLFGLVPGTLLAVLASTLGASLVFLAARAGFADAVARGWRGRGSPAWLAPIERELVANGVSYLLLLRLVPAVPFPLANIAPALAGVRLRTFVATTFLGILPGTFVTAWIGVGIGEAFDRGGTPGLGLMLQPHILGPTLLLCALVALPILRRRRRRR
jgi:uncharacterized membrane protein YdjX (TVP38/TMEM64 family)